MPGAKVKGLRAARGQRLGARAPEAKGMQLTWAPHRSVAIAPLSLARSLSLSLSVPPSLPLPLSLRSPLNHRARGLNS